MDSLTGSPRPWGAALVLEGEHVRLEPLAPYHAAGLFEIGANPDVWTWLTHSEFRTLSDAEGYIALALEAGANGGESPFAVIHKVSGRVAGTTRYLDIRPGDKALEIGWTWYGAPYQRTAVNSETKLLLMTHAFETLGANRVQLKTDSRNLRSQAAIARLGAVKEGVLRRDRILIKDGYVRDSVYFSVLAEEWPAVKERLLGFLAGARDV
jgi:RimJ/RimL family protein N-acetyltransferase